jgi:hypothetical protein
MTGWWDRPRRISIGSFGISRPGARTLGALLFCTGYPCVERALRARRRRVIRVPARLDRLLHAELSLVEATHTLFLCADVFNLFLLFLRTSDSSMIIERSDVKCTVWMPTSALDEMCVCILTCSLTIGAAAPRAFPPPFITPCRTTRESRQHNHLRLILTSFIPPVA